MGKPIGYALVFAAALAWSTAGLFTRVVSADIPTTLFWRSLSGGLCVLALAVWMRRRRGGGCGARDLFALSRGEALITALSAIGMIFFIAAFFHASIATVSFIYGAMPLVTVALAAVALGRRQDLATWLCCLTAALGVGLLAGGAPAGEWLGMGLAFGMTFFMAALTVAAKAHPDADPIKATYMSAFLGAAVVAPLVRFDGIPAADYLWLWLYGLVNVGLGFGVYLLGVARISAAAAALVGLAEVPLAPVWAWALFDERVGARAALGGAIALGAAAAHLIRQHRAAAPADGRGG